MYFNLSSLQNTSDRQNLSNDYECCYPTSAATLLWWIILNVSAYNGRAFVSDVSAHKNIQEEVENAIRFGLMVSHEQ